jgi:integrase
MFGGFLPLSNNKIETHFKDDLEKAGMPDMRVHDLRHSHASLLWHSGVPVPEISKRLGHSSSKTTMAIYAHIFDTHQTATLNVLNNL